MELGNVAHVCFCGTFWAAECTAGDMRRDYCEGLLHSWESDFIHFKLHNIQNNTKTTQMNKKIKYS